MSRLKGGRGRGLGWVPETWRTPSPFASLSLDLAAFPVREPNSQVRVTVLY